MNTVQDGAAVLAWLENKLYLVHEQSQKVRVFEGHAPFNELPEAIELRGILGFVGGVVASQIHRSLFISDEVSRSICKIQLPKKEL